MEDKTLKFKRSEKIGEVILAIFIVALFLVIQLPIIPTPDKTVIYATAVAYVVYVFVWHKIKPPLKPMNKNFLESLVGLLAISVVVHASGGNNSYFNFLYLLPNLSISTMSTKWHALSFWLITVGFILAEALIFGQPQLLSLGLLSIWAVGLVSFYGRSLAHEVGSAQGAATEATIEKEKAINRLKDEFVFLISHELRGPITAIRGYLELFLTSGEKIPEQVKNQAKLAFKQSEKLNNLIIQLLDLSRLETGKFKLTNEKFDLNQFLNESLESTVLEAQEKKVKFEFRSLRLPIVVFADKERVREVVLNLVENAFRYTSEFGQIWVWVEVVEGFARVSIADTGLGIPPEEINQVFSRFYTPKDTAGRSSLEQGKSVGLGLYLTRQLIEKSGGQINVESKFGKGSKFTFTLPLAKTGEVEN